MYPNFLGLPGISLVECIDYGINTCFNHQVLVAAMLVSELMQYLTIAGFLFVDAFNLISTVILVV